jgi:hypothetical protein
MVTHHVVFTLIICKIFLSQMPGKCIHILCHLAANPKESHIHGSCLLPLNCAVCNPDGSGIVAMHRFLWLGVSQVFQDASKNDACLAIMEERPKFRLGG